MYPKAVIFDFDNTLYDESEYFRVVINAFCKDKNLSQEIGDELLAHLKKIRPTSKNIFKDLLEPFDLFSKENSDLFFDYYTGVATELPLFSDTLAVLNYVKEKKIKCFLLTNGLLKAQKNKLRCARIAHHFEHVFFARMFGREYEKPHIRMYKHIEEETKISACDCLYVGDNLRTDFITPYQMGGTTVFLNSTNQPLHPKPKFITFEVSRLSDLKAII